MKRTPTPPLNLLGLITGLVLNSCAPPGSTTTPPTTSETADTVNKTDAAQGPFFAWVQLDTETSASARVITAREHGCPKIMVDGQTHAMRPRGPAEYPTGFEAILVCQYPLSTANAPKQLAVEAPTGLQQLPPPTSATQDLLVLGDTGCRNKGADYLHSLFRISQESQRLGLSHPESEGCKNFAPAHPPRGRLSLSRKGLPGGPALRVQLGKLAGRFF